MRKILATLLIIMLSVNIGYAANQFATGEPEGTQSPSDIDTLIEVNNLSLNSLLTNYRENCKITWTDANTLSVAAGEIVASAASGTIKRYRQNTSATSVTFSDLDTGSEAASTTYYVYATADTDIAGFLLTISASSSAPTGYTYYKRLGSFLNDSGSDITQSDIFNDNNYYGLSLGTWVSKTEDVTYQATTDGYVTISAMLGAGVSSGSSLIAYTDSSSNPTTERGKLSNNQSSADNGGDVTFTMPVKKGDYWKTVTSGTISSIEIYWIPNQ